MEKFVIAIEETVVNEFEVCAENSEQAMEIAKIKYKCGEFVLSPGELCAKQMAVFSPGEVISEWKVF